MVSAALTFSLRARAIGTGTGGCLSCAFGLVSAHARAHDRDPATGSPGPSAEAASEAHRLLDRCTRHRTSEGVCFACDGFAASVADYPGLPAPEVLRIHLASFKALGGGETSSVATSLQVGDRTWDGARFTAHRAGGEAFLEGRAFALELRAGSTRLVSCGAPAGKPADRCLDILPVLAVAGPDPYRPAPVDPSFLGRKVPVPKGCRTLNASETAFRIACGEIASLSFNRLDSAESMDRFVNMMREQLLRSLPGSTEGKERACRIGRVPARCKVVAAGDGAGRVFVYVGAAVVDRVPVSVQCAQHAIVKGVHPVCAGVLAFWPGQAHRDWPLIPPP